MIKRFLCYMFGHDYHVHQEFTSYSRRVVCDKCGGDWAINDDLRVVCDWNGQFHDLYSRFGHEIKPRIIAANAKEPT